VQFARLEGHPLTTPRIAAPGCGAPLVAPLAAGVRVSGEDAGAPFLSRLCAPNEPGVTLPAGNVAVNGALTAAALYATPEQPDPFYAPLYSRVLPSGLSQVTAMMVQHPTFVSVELGANEVLGARDGAYIPFKTVVPVAAWVPDYRKVLDAVQQMTSHAVLVGLANHAINFPSFRTGDELWQARATFAPFNVVVSVDCQASANVLFVPVIVPTAVAKGAYYQSHQYGPYPLSCADSPPLAPDGSVIRDYILSPADIALVDAQLSQMNAIIRVEALTRRFAYFALGTLYDEVNVKAPFSAVTLMTSSQPYGPYISLDGVHPSAAGNAILAAAAARAITDRQENIASVAQSYREQRK
jgi:lysophospholipase L1-like esterase